MTFFSCCFNFNKVKASFNKDCSQILKTILEFFWRYILKKNRFFYYCTVIARWLSSVAEIKEKRNKKNRIRYNRYRDNRCTKTKQKTNSQKCIFSGTEGSETLRSIENRVSKICPGYNSLCQLNQTYVFVILFIFCCGWSEAMWCV